MKTITKFLIAFVVVLLSIWSINQSLDMINQKDTLLNILGLAFIFSVLSIDTYLIILTLKHLKQTMKKFFPLLIIPVIFSLSSCERIDAGHVGIKVSMYGDDKGVNDITLVTGRVWYNPLTADIIEFPVFTQTKDYDPFVVNSKDASEFTVDPTLSYFVNSDKVPFIFQQYRKKLSQLEDGFIRNLVYDAYRISANKFTSDSLMSNRQKFEDMVQKQLTETLEKEGFIFQQLTSALTPPHSLKAAIDAKNTAIQTAMQAENKVKQAEAEAKIKKAQAEGTAESLIIQAKAEAEANRLRQQSLTSLLVQQQFIEKWDGKLPQYGTVPQLFRDISK